MFNSNMAQLIKNLMRVGAIGVGLALVIWVFASLVQGLIFGEETLVRALLQVAPGATVRRILAPVLSLCFGILAYWAGMRRAHINKMLNKAPERYRRLVEHYPDATILQGEEGIVYVNRSGAALLGAKDVKAILGRAIWDFFPSEYKTIIEKRAQQIREEIKEASPIELRLNRLDGRQIEVEVMAIPYAGDSESVLQFIIHDITTRKWVEEQIRQRNIELSALNAIAATVSQTLDLNRILNESLRCVLDLDILGGHAQGMIFLRGEGSDALTLAAHRGAPADHPCLTQAPRVGECLCGMAVQLGTPVLSEDSHQDLRHSRAWPDMPHHRDVCLPLRVHGRVMGAMDVRLPVDRNIDEKVVALLTSVADQISVAIENARLFEEVTQQGKRLRVLSARVAEAEEAERKRLARELHDQVGEGLTALGINLNILRAQLPKGSGEKLDQTVVDSLALVEKTTERIRDVMAELRPPMLDDYGLLATLRWYGSQFSRRAGVVVDVSGEEPTPPLPASIESAAFRILTEALTNVAKHAKASHVTVNLGGDEEAFCLTITDNGVGFDIHRSLPEGQERGWGLLTMGERAEAVGGRLRIESDPSNGGTRVIVEVPR